MFFYCRIIVSKFWKRPVEKSKKASADKKKTPRAILRRKEMEDIHSGAISALKSGGQAISSVLPVTGWVSESLTALS